MAFEVTTTREFAAAHAIRLYDGSMEPLHGHNWRVSVTVGSDGLDSIGVVMDFHLLERLVNAIVDPWHNRSLNELADFADFNPTTEHVALLVGKRLELPAGLKVLSVTVWETSTCAATYRP
jgi:6-pyruvoyltetrahydropterin/6-carboxytetrahydropterin synthase